MNQRISTWGDDGPDKGHPGHGGMQMKTLLTGVLISINFIATKALAQEVIDGPCTPIEVAGYVIDKPGKYCVIKDLYTRLDFADHSTEPAIIEIKSSNVTVDLQGHQLGKGWRLLPMQPSSNGIAIGGRNYHFENFENIYIKNGRISDAQVAIYFRREHKFLSKKASPRSLAVIGSQTYAYEPAKIIIKDIFFLNCDFNFQFDDWAESRDMFLREKDATQEIANPYSYESGRTDMTFTRAHHIGFLAPFLSAAI